MTDQFDEDERERCADEIEHVEREQVFASTDHATPDPWSAA